MKKNLINRVFLAKSKLSETKKSYGNAEGIAVLDTDALRKKSVAPRWNNGFAFQHTLATRSTKIRNTVPPMNIIE